MAGDITLTMIKPYAVTKNYTGDIITQINKAGFKIKALKMTWLSPLQAQQFYAVHKDRPFYNDLVQYMASGPIVAMVLQKENAVADFRKLIGATDPAEAAEGTIRKRFGTDKQRNAVHGSDSDENAIIESNFHFAIKDQYAY